MPATTAQPNRGGLGVAGSIKSHETAYRRPGERVKGKNPFHYTGKGKKPKKRKKRKEGEAATEPGSVQWYHELVRFAEEAWARNHQWWEIVSVNARQKREMDLVNPSMEEWLEEIRPARINNMVSLAEAMVLARPGHFTMRGNSPRLDVTEKRSIEETMNVEWVEDNKTRQNLRKAVHNCIKYGRGIVMSQVITRDDKAEVAKRREDQRILEQSDPEMAAILAEVEGTAAGLAAGGPPDEREETSDENTNLIYDVASSINISPWQFMIDPDGTDEDDSKFMVRILVKTYQSVLDDPTMNTVGLMPTAKERIHHPWAEGADASGASPYEYVLIYEVWERTPTGWRRIRIADGYDDFLTPPEDDVFWIGCPFRFLQWNGDDEHPYPIGDIVMFWTEILAERLLLTKAVDGFAREMGDRTYVDSALGLSEEHCKVISDPDLGTLVEVNMPSDTKSLANHFFYPQKQAKSPDMTGLLIPIQESLRMSSGSTENLQGGAMRSGTTAGEAGEVALGARARGAYKVEATEQFAEGIMGDRMGLMAQYYSGVDIFRLAGKAAADAWLKASWTKADAQRGMYMKIERGSLEPDDTQARLQRLLKAVALGNQDPVWRSMMNAPEIFTLIFRELGFPAATKLLLQRDGEDISKQVLEFAQLQGQGQGQGQQGSQPGVPDLPQGAGAVTQDLQGAAV